MTSKGDMRSGQQWSEAERQAMREANARPMTEQCEIHGEPWPCEVCRSMVMKELGRPFYFNVVAMYEKLGYERDLHRMKCAMVGLSLA